MDELTIRIVLWASLVALVGYFFRGFLQEGGKDSYSWLRGRLFGEKKTELTKDSPLPEPSTTIAPVQTPQLTPEVTVDQIKEAISSAPAQTPQLAPQLTPHHPQVTIDDIEKVIKSVPPFQREEAAARYVGFRVDWPAFFCDARQEGDIVYVDLYSSTQLILPRISCEVLAADYPQLRILTEGVPLRISGVISKAGLSVHLTEARLDFHR